MRRGDLDAWIASRQVTPIEGVDDADIERRVARLARARPRPDAASQRSRVTRPRIAAPTVGTRRGVQGAELHVQDDCDDFDPWEHTSAWKFVDCLAQWGRLASSGRLTVAPARQIDLGCERAQRADPAAEIATAEIATNRVSGATFVVRAPKGER